MNVSFAQHLTADQRTWLWDTRVPLRSLSFARVGPHGEAAWDFASDCLLTDAALLPTSTVTLQVPYVVHPCAH